MNNVTPPISILDAMQQVATQCGEEQARRKTESAAERKLREKAAQWFDGAFAKHVAGSVERIDPWFEGFASDGKVTSNPYLKELVALREANHFEEMPEVEVHDE